MTKNTQVNASLIKSLDLEIKTVEVDEQGNETIITEKEILLMDQVYQIKYRRLLATAVATPRTIYFPEQIKNEVSFEEIIVTGKITDIQYCKPKMITDEHSGQYYTIVLDTSEAYTSSSLSISAGDILSIELIGGIKYVIG